MSNGHTLANERRFSEELALSGLDPDSYSRWVKCLSGHRFLIGCTEKLVAFKYQNGKPDAVDTFELVEFRVSKSCAALKSVWVKSDGSVFLVSHTPVEVAKGCFLFHVMESTLIARPARAGVQSMLVSMSYRTQNNPNKRLEDCLYLQEEIAFNKSLKVSNV